MYHVSAQGIDERMINVHYYYYYFEVPNWFKFSNYGYINSFEKCTGRENINRHFCLLLRRSLTGLA